MKRKVFLALLLISIFMLSGCGNEAKIGVDSIEISKKNLYMAEGQTTVISAQVYPFNADNQNYYFETSNNGVVEIEEGFVIAKKAGDAVIYVFSEDGGYKDSCNVLVTKASDNLALNQYNNLNMPEKDLKPIILNDSKNTENGNKNDSSKNVTKNVTKNTIKNMSSKNNSNGMNKNTNSKSTSKPKRSFKDAVKDMTQKVNAEVKSEIVSSKNVLEDIKSELTNSIASLEYEKEMFAETFGDNSFFSFQNTFNKIRREMIDAFKTTKQELINDITDLEDKIDSNEYTVESKNINGVTFVVVKNKA